MRARPFQPHTILITFPRVPVQSASVQAWASCLSPAHDHTLDGTVAGGERTRAEAASRAMADKADRLLSNVEKTVAGLIEAQEAMGPKFGHGCVTAVTAAPSAATPARVPRCKLPFLG